MAIWIRKVSEDKSINFLKLAEDDWNLMSQFEAFSSWLDSGAEALDSNFEWIADIGFRQRADATGGGPVISRDVMAACLKYNITIFLSEYGGENA